MIWFLIGHILQADKHSRKTNILIFIGLILVPFIFMGIGMASVHKAKVLEPCTQKVTAYITSAKKYHDDKGFSYWKAQYEYDYNGVHYSDTTSYYNYQTTEEIYIDPDHPEINKWSGESEDNFKFGYTFMNVAVIWVLLYAVIDLFGGLLWAEQLILRGR